jgi:pyruvate/2-oxoacid:ferredoxin oxidoreductase beta subunit
LHLARLAVESRVFPLVEIEDGERVRITVKPREVKPVARYFEVQGRFQHLTVDEVSAIQASVDAAWTRWLARAAASNFQFPVSNFRGSKGTPC